MIIDYYLNHKSFRGSVSYSIKDHLFSGKIENIRDIVIFHSTSLEGIRLSFIEAVDQYLEDCKEIGMEPDNLV